MKEMKSILILLVCALITLSVTAQGKKTARSVVEGDIPNDVVESKCKSKEKYNKYEAETHVKRCPPGWSRYKNEKCFKISSPLEPAVNHDGAQTACESIGSTLASITNQSEATFLKSLLLRETALETDLQSLWIGLRRKFGSLFWYDLTESNFEGNNFSLSNLPWAVPLQLALGQLPVPMDCGSLATDAVTMANRTEDFGKILMASCDELKGFVCQKFITEKGSCGCS